MPMPIARRGPLGGTVITVEGTFDSAAAARLKALVLDLDASAPLTVDFRAVRLFHDCAVEALAEAVSRHPTARLIGLSEHQYRLLRYFHSASARARPTHP